MASTAPPEIARPATHQTIGGPSAGQLAWIAAVPCAIVAAAAAALLGPPLGRMLLAPGSVRFMWTELTRPEPTEHARFLVAVLAPVALSLFVALAARRDAGDGRPRAAVRVAQWLLLAAVAFAVVAQHLLAYRVGAGLLYAEHRVYFTDATLAVAIAIAAAIAALLRRPAVVERVAALTRETRARRLAALALAAALVASWMLTAFNTEGSIGHADATVSSNAPVWLDETFAVLNGAFPLTSFHAQYAQLLPYATAGTMAVLGGSYGVYAGLMASATAAAMLAIFALLRRVVGSSLLALALFAPFAATSFFKVHGTLENRYGPSNLFSVFPIRYGGPYVLAWLLARRLGGARPRSAAALCLAGGLVALNNPELGGPAFVATVAALALTLPRWTWRAAGRLAGAAALGAGGAALAVALLTLTTAGGLPRVALLTEFPRIYGIDGFGMFPMPVAGFHLAIYLTFAAALVLATVRAIGRERDVVLTGMLCWIGVFGPGAGAYYAGRSHPDVLIDVFSPWALALALLLVAAVRAIRARASLWPSAAELAVLAGFGLATCSVAQTPLPWSQLSRLTGPASASPLRLPAVERFVRQRTTRGERVMILAPLGHRIAYDVGVRNVFPYADIVSVPTSEQWDGILRVVREQHVRSIFTPASLVEVVLERLQSEGFRLAAASADGGQTLQLVR